MVAALLVAPLLRWIDDTTRWTVLDLSVEGARSLIEALAASLLTFIVFAFSILLLAIQMASGQLTPRMIVRVFDDRLTKLTVGAFVFAWVYTLAVLGRIGDRAPQLPVALAMILSLVAVGLFLYLVQSTIEGMRPITILTNLAQEMRGVIDTVYPTVFQENRHERARPDINRTHARTTVRYRGHSGTVLAFDVDGLKNIAARARCVIEIAPQVGDSIATGDNLFLLYGTDADSVPESELYRHVSFGSERALEHDPAFGFRIAVDIASKALSPAINDPTTAVLALDQLQYFLHLIGQRQLDDGVVCDASGEVRLLYRTPGWGDFVTLAVTEVRLYGATSPQVTRRLCAMFEHLLSSIPPARVTTLTEQMSLLRSTIERSFPAAEDRALAQRADLQGFGSRTLERH